MAIDPNTAPADAVGAPGVGGRTRPRSRAWGVLALLVCLMLVNFADKVVVGLAGSGIKHELVLGDAKFGVIQSSFYWLFAVGAILGGWLGGRVKARWLLAGVAAVWTLSLAPLAGQVGFTTILACRVVLGFAEGPTTALAMQVAHSWFPAHRRAVPSSLVIAGAGIGPLIAAPLLTWVIEAYSWHAAFAVLAAFGALVCVLWLWLGDSGPEGAAEGPTEGTAEVRVGDAGRPAYDLPAYVPLRRIFTTGTLIGMLALFFVAYACTAVGVSWLPLYLHEGLGYSTKSAGSLVALPFLGSAIAVIAVGFLSRSLTARGCSGRITRVVLPAVLVLASAVCTIGFSSLGRGPLQMVLLILGSCLNSAGYGAAFAGLGDVAPVKQRGTVFGIVIAVYSLGGVLAPLVIGRLTASGASTADGYGNGFLVLGVTMLVGALAALLLADPDRDAAKLAGTPGPDSLRRLTADPMTKKVKER